MWDDLEHQLDELRKRGRFRELVSRRVEGVYLTDDDRNRLINFGSNDYLGMSSHLASQLPLLELLGSKASGLVCGWTERHEILARELSRFEQTESAIVFPSGFAACSGTVAALCRRGDLIISDELNHASLIDGCRLAGATRAIFPHRDVGWIDEHLQKHRSEFNRVWLITDSVFSMDGHVAPLKDLCDVAERHGATMIVDEAHATGVLGEGGRGAAEAFGLKSRIPIRIGTLSKAIGGQGGFVACPSVVADYLTNHCRTLIFSTALSLPAVEAAIIAVRSTDELRRRREKLHELTRLLRDRLSIDGGPIESMIPILPVPVGSDSAAVEASQRLRRLGLYVPAIRPPTVAEGESRLRISLSAEHTAEMVELLADGIRSF